MPLDLDLSIAPYFDDYDETKDFYSVLYRPGYGVQTRELNQTQAILRNQLARFADSIFKNGTIVEGCNFFFRPDYSYVKILDNEISGLPSAPGDYVGLFVRNAANLQAFVIDHVDGFEAATPDLKTIYVSYRNAGSDSNTHFFSPGDLLTVFDSNSSVFSVQVNNGGVGFSNADQVVFVPALVVNVSSGSFTNGDYVTQDDLSSNLQIVNIDTLTLANSGQVILSLWPRNLDLASLTTNSQAWAVSNNDSIRNITNTATGSVEAVLGNSATASLQTDGAGRLLSVTLTAGGFGYAPTSPQVRVRSANNTTGLNSLNLASVNYRAQLRVANTVDAIGNGYAFGVSNGVVYLKGLFLRADSQTIIVDKYDSLPNNVVAGFTAREEIIDSNIDPSLLDNATGEPDEFAPGANRLQITPVLEVAFANTTQANDSFYPICAWSEGNPYKQNQPSAYSALGDALALRTFETDGDFVLDKFLVTTRSPFASNAEGTKFSVVVDPGTAYVSGYRVGTLRNFIIDDNKGTDVQVSNNQLITLNYGSWVRTKSLGGVFLYSTGDAVSLYDVAKNFLSTPALIVSANLVPQGNLIGTARIRSLSHEFGIEGDPNTHYRAYLFDINMNAGKNFANVRSIAYSGTSNGIMDVVLELDPTTSQNVALLHDLYVGDLLVPAGVESLQLSANIFYNYRTLDLSLSISNAGLLTKSLASSPNEFFIGGPGLLSPSNESDLLLIPLANLVASANLTGTVTTSTASPNVVGSSTTFITDVVPGDFLAIGNSTANCITRIISVVNNTLVIADSNAASVCTALIYRRLFPAQVPIPLDSRAGFSSSVDANNNILTVNLNTAFLGSASTNVALGVNISRQNVLPGTKTAVRNQFVKIYLGNNAGGVSGPWTLGVSDVIRLGGVWRGTSNAVTTNSTPVASNFYIDHNQRQDFLDLSYLFVRPSSGISLDANTWLLVELDYASISTGTFFDATSYVTGNAAQVAINDALPLANLGSAFNSFEISEVFTAQGNYFDLAGCFDFRPSAVNTATLSANSQLAPVNPAYSLSFGNTANPANDKKFPVPASSMEASITQWIGRTDSVFLGKDGNIVVASGIPNADRGKQRAPNQPNGSLLLNTLLIPSYPTLPKVVSNNMAVILNTGMANERFSNQRITRKTVVTPLSLRQIEAQQPAGFTMSDIGSLKRRIENLEYYQSLSLLETDVNTRVIPSSVDPTLDRFKFGFFADDFSSQVSQETTNPQYAAQIINNKLLPNSFNWTVSTPGNSIHHVCYIDFPICSQNTATSPNTPPPGHPPGPNCVPTTIITTSILCNKEDDDRDRGFRTDDDDDFPKNITFRASSLPGQITIYFHHYSAPCKIKVYQGSTFLHSCDDAVPLTPVDVTYVQGPKFPSAWFKNISFRDCDHPFSHFSRFSGKITWTHDPSRGRDYVVTITKGSGCSQWRHAIEYCIDSATVTCLSPPVPKPCEYRGSCDPDPRCFKTRLRCREFHDEEDDDRDRCDRAFDCDRREDHCFHVVCRGHKPHCKHDIFCEGINKNHRCRPFGGRLGDDCISDEFGTCEFDFFFSSDLDNDLAEGIFNSITAPNPSNNFCSSLNSSTGGGCLKLECSAPASYSCFSIPWDDDDVQLCRP